MTGSELSQLLLLRIKFATLRAFKWFYMDSWSNLVMHSRISHQLQDPAAATLRQKQKSNLQPSLFFQRESLLVLQSSEQARSWSGITNCDKETTLLILLLFVSSFDQNSQVANAELLSDSPWVANSRPTKTSSLHTGCGTT